MTHIPLITYLVLHNWPLYFLPYFTPLTVAILLASSLDDCHLYVFPFSFDDSHSCVSKLVTISIITLIRPLVIIVIHSPLYPLLMIVNNFCHCSFVFYFHTEKRKKKSLPIIYTISFYYSSRLESFIEVSSYRGNVVMSWILYLILIILQFMKSFEIRWFINIM